VLRGKGWVVNSRFKRGVAPKKKFLDFVSFRLSDCLIGLADHVLNHVQKIRLESNRIEHPPLFESNRTLISLIRFDRIIIGQIRFDSIRSELYLLSCFIAYRREYLKLLEKWLRSALGAFTNNYARSKL
jgi:hypothetical protein